LTPEQKLFNIGNVESKGLGARFVSKKVVVMITRSEAAQQIADAVEAYDREDYRCSVWEKAGRCRIYIKDMGYANAKAQDQGYIQINTDGTVCFDNLKKLPRGVQKTVEALNLQIARDEEGAEALAKSYIKKPQTIQGSWAAYHADHPAGYNRFTGSWDSALDRDDYEG
jgi:hypothetical protein